MKSKINFKLIKYIVAIVVIFFTLIIFNPFSINDSGYRTHVQTVTGTEFIRFKPGVFWTGFFSKQTRYPDVITVVFTNKDIDEKVTSLNPSFQIRFNDATRAEAEATVRWRMPKVEDAMIMIHKEYRSPEKLAETTLSRYTKECLRYAAQLMESESHYSGGMSKLSEDFQNQLEEGQYVLDYKTEYVTDSITDRETKLTTTFIRKDNNGVIQRNKSDVQQFYIDVASASVDEVNYEEQIDLKLKQKIDASTRESISKQNLITAKQEALTAAEEGERRLIEIKYEEKQIQTQRVIQRQTEVLLANEDINKELAAYEAAKLEALSIKVKADAEAYAKQKVMNADGALDKKLEAFKYAVDRNAAAIENSSQPLVPAIVIGSIDNAPNGGSVRSLLDMMMVTEAKKLMINPNPTK